MTIRESIARWLSDALPTAPPEGEAMAYSTGQQAFGDTAARIGTYASGKLGWATMTKMLDHYQVAAGADLIALPLMGAEYSVEGEPEIAAYVHAVTDRIWPQVLKSCAHGVLTGFAPNEVPFEHATTHIIDDANGIDKDVDGWRPAKVKDIDPGNIASILVDGYGNFQGYKSVTPNADIEAERVLHFAYGVRYGNWWGKGRLTRAYDPWYRAVLTSDQMMRYLDRLGTPPVKVFHTPGKSGDDAHSTAATAMGEGFTGGETHFALPLSAKQGKDGGTEYYRSWDVELLQDDARGAMFLAALEYHNKCVLRGLLIPDTVFSQSGQVGSLALSQTHLDSYLMGEDGVLAEIVAAYNEQIVPRIVRYTFGANAPIPTLVTQGLTDEARAFAAEIFKEAVRTGQVAVEWDKMADRLNIPTNVEEDAAPVDEARKEIAALAVQARDARLMLMSRV